MGKPAPDIRWAERSRASQGLTWAVVIQVVKGRNRLFYLENLIPRPFMFVGVFQEVTGIGAMSLVSSAQ